MSTNKQANTDVKNIIRQCWGQFCEIAKTENRPELIERFEPEIKRFELGLFRIVIMGEIKKGKTSFINALLGAPDLLPVTSDIATSVVFQIMYGAKRTFQVFFQPDIDTGKRDDPIEISQNQLRDYGTEDGNPRNEKRVDFIGVSEPSPMLEEGIVLVDTPGVGGMFKAHRDVTWRYAPNADAIFFVLDSVESVMSRDEVAFLKELKDQLKKQVFFVQTKIDAVDSEQSEGWRNRNQSILQNDVGIPEKSIRYFPISSLLKNEAADLQDDSLLEESGFPALLNFIHRGLIAKKNDMLASRLAASLAATCNEIYGDQKNRLALLQTQSTEELANIRAKLDQAKSDMTQWERDTFKQEQQNLRIGFDNIKRKYRRIVQEELDPSGPIVTETIKKLREGSLSPKQLVENSEAIQQDWLASAAEQTMGMQEAYNNEVVSLIGEVSQRLNLDSLSSCTDLVPAESGSGGPLISPEKIHSTFSNFDSMRGVMLGATAGATMAMVGIGLASVICPPIGILASVAPLFGLGMGGLFSKQSADANKKEEVLNKLKQQLHSLASRVLRYTTNHLDELGVNYERQISGLFQNAVADARKRLDEQGEQAKLAMSQTKEESARQVEDLKQRTSTVEAVLKTLARLLPQQKPTHP
ncbi:MAG: dynamin family protein [Thermoguttaceae bacterium]